MICGAEGNGKNAGDSLDGDHTKNQKNEERRQARRELLDGLGGALVKAAVFWCASGLMLAAIYAGIVKLTSGSVFEVSGPVAAVPGSQSMREDAGGDAAKDVLQETEKKAVALTFDDGPHPVYTKELLDGLKERGVQATFFVIGKNIEGNEDLIARMEEEGHLIGNHTYDHVKISDMSQEDACCQVQKTSALVKEITGHDTEFVRPPFGAWKKDMECGFVMIPVLWDVDPLDWTTSDTSLVVRRVVDDVEDQDIILLHDCYESSVQAALQIVDTLRDEGYEFVTADQLVLD